MPILTDAASPENGGNPLLVVMALEAPLIADDIIDEPPLIAEDIIEEPSLMAELAPLMADDITSLDDELDELEVLDALLELVELLELEPQAARVSVAAVAAARIPAMRGRSTISPSDRK